MTEIIRGEGLVKEYAQGGRPVRALDGVDLTVEGGEFLAIMGPSGSGKSTLLHIIGALDRPTEGRLLIRGVDLSELSDVDLAELRNREIGFVFQFFNLIPRMDALRNVELPLAIAGVPREERRRRAMELLKLVGLGDRVTHRPGELSGGEQQRVAIARALANDPSIILCDEPTGNLDSKTGEEVIGLMKELNQESGKTFIIVTHDPTVAQMTERILYLHDGRIVGEKRRGL
ncbi:MAG: macrolide ABC transporter ATP-binding protein [Candidatus Bathyarchaeota archaeon B23]|nr:MAG: macrolide ABC transporter ATP-binding protein [Candidatus Bathyarchaeota archaeon B23]